MPHSDIVFALTGDVRVNSRAIRQLRGLATLAPRIDVLTLGDAGPAPALPPGVRLHLLERPGGSGPRFFRAVHRLMRDAARALPARVYHASDLYVLPAMRQAADAHGARLAYDARECYPHVSATTGRPWSRAVWYAVEGAHIRRADAVFTVSDGIADRLARIYRIPRPTLVYNVPPRRDVVPAGRLRMLAGLDADVPLVLHVGALRRDRGLEDLVAAMGEVPHAALVFLGGGELAPAVDAAIETRGLGARVRRVPPVPPDAVLAHVADADVGVVNFHDTCLNHRMALPNKLFEYLVAGVPVVAADLPEIRRVVAHGVGRVVPPGDVDALAGALSEATGDAALRARWKEAIPAVFETFSWESAFERLLSVYRTLLG